MTPLSQAIPPRPTPAELEILRVLWQHGARTVREVQEQLEQERPTGYTTVLKLLQIMTDKGLVRRDESARAHVYAAKAPEETTQSQLVLHALSTRKSSKQELSQIRELLDRLEGGKR